MFVIDLLTFKASKFLQPHLQYGLGLLLAKVEIRHKPIPGLFHGLACPDKSNDLVDMVQCNLQSFQDMGALAGLLKFELAAPGDHHYSVVNEMYDKFFQVQHQGLAVYQCQINDAERGLHLGMFV